jgi:hypothetical protein
MSTYTPIASQTLASATNSVVFSSIPQGYTDLVLVITNVKHNFAGSDTVQDNVIQFNGDTASNYSFTQITGDGSTATSTRGSNQTGIAGAYPMASAGVAGSMVININNYSNTTTYKTVLVRSSTDTSARFYVNLWRGFSAITSMNVAPSGSYTMSAGTIISLYGIQVGDKAQKAQGGNIVTSDGTYIYHAFTASGYFIPNEALTADVLVIAGGGGAGRDKGGGGGAGGLSYQTSRSITAKTYPVVVGAGGTSSYGYTEANPTGGVGGSAGNNSVFDTIVSLGGGIGGSDNTTNYRNGASGGSGGGATRNGTIGSATQGNSGGATGFGFNGGSGTEGGGGYYSGGGGGGAGAVGGNAASVGGVGGAGVNTYSSWASATSTGVSGYYAAGGGGGVYVGSGTATGGAGGAGGGGTGGNWNASTPIGTVGTAGVANTGSGGGGGGADQIGGAGGSGIVIIRYLA